MARADLALFVALLLAASTDIAGAVNLTNKDDRSYDLTIVERKGAQVHTIEARGKLEGVCRSGCMLRVGKDPDLYFQFEGDEVVSIERGLIYYDGQEARKLRKEAAPEADKQ